MNKNRRSELARAKKLLKKASAAVEEARGIVENTFEEETEYVDNIPENFRNSERYKKAEDILGWLDEAFEKLDTMYEDLEESMDLIASSCE